MKRLSGSMEVTITKKKYIGDTGNTVFPFTQTH